jgi:hypothetical protein
LWKSSPWITLPGELGAKRETFSLLHISALIFGPSDSASTFDLVRGPWRFDRI